MNIDKFLNQEATLKKFINKTGSNKKTYEEPYDIMARIELKNKTVRTAAGPIIDGNGTIITTEILAIGDVIVYNGKEYTVNRILHQPPDKYGTIVYTEALIQ